MNKLYRKQTGFTLLEVAAVVAISGTLAAMSVPMVKDYQASKAVGAVQEAFVGDLKLAREAAVSTGQPVSVCPSTDGVSCNASQWNKGWIVYQGASSDSITEANILHYSPVTQELDFQVYDENPVAVAHLKFDEKGFSASVSRLTAAMCLADSQSTTLVIERSGRVLDASQNQEYQKSFSSSLKHSKVAIQSHCFKA